MTTIGHDLSVLEALVRDLGLTRAETYARRISSMPGGYYSAQYARIANELRRRMNAEFQNRLHYLAQVAALPGYHPVENDLGTVPL